MARRKRRATKPKRKKPKFDDAAEAAILGEEVKIEIPGRENLNGYRYKGKVYPNEWSRLWLKSNYPSPDDYLELMETCRIGAKGEEAYNDGYPK